MTRAATASRRYLDSLPPDTTGWLAGPRDSFVGRALALLHEKPAKAWTLDELGREVGLSRSPLHGSIALEVGYRSEAAFARAFKRLMGQPPAAWRRTLGQPTRA